MYEISLVPDVKSQLIEKQKMRNLIVLICFVVIGACVAVILLIMSLVGGQSLALTIQEKEISCRADGTVPKGGTGSCGSEYGKPILTYENVNELLTIQNQMKSISALNGNKVKFSRVFGLLDVILPDGSSNGDRVEISELNANVEQNVLSFDAVGYAENNIGYHALETFKKGLAKTYFDYGNYMRFDSDTGEYVIIPSFCIKERTVKGYTYGDYSKGAPGCEAPMVESSSSDSEDEESADDEETSDDEEENSSKKNNSKKENKVEVITIRRTYDSSEDREQYKAGNDSKGERDSDSSSHYYFESACLKYDADGQFDEESTLEACPVLGESGVSTPNSSYGRGSNDEMVLSFSASVNVNSAIFKSANKFMQIIGPSRQNVTDSYVQIRNMFGEPAKAINNSDNGGE